MVYEQQTFCLLALFKTVQFVSLKCTFKMMLPILLQRQSSIICSNSWNLTFANKLQFSLISDLLLLKHQKIDKSSWDI